MSAVERQLARNDKTAQIRSRIVALFLEIEREGYQFGEIIGAVIGAAYVLLLQRHPEATPQERSALFKQLASDSADIFESTIAPKM
ncbi:MAG TPA: hypothetical protein VHE81_15180 [Lacipirellulaceae bacterium]|nr:hypothetical protein [Lacipirellulaceae bacterium]